MLPVRQDHVHAIQFSRKQPWLDVESKLNYNKLLTNKRIETGSGGRVA